MEVSNHRVVLDALTRLCINSALFEKLNIPFLLVEIFNALTDMTLSKEPERDEYQASFYQKAWVVIGGDVAKIVIDVFNGGLIPIEVNKTSLFLIPKVANLECCS